MRNGYLHYFAFVKVSTRVFNSFLMLKKRTIPSNLDLANLEESCEDSWTIEWDKRNKLCDNLNYIKACKKKQSICLIQVNSAVVTEESETQ